MQSEKEQVALTSIAASAMLTIAKGLVGFATGSLAILSEAGHSLIDLGATVMTYAAVRISGKPADKEHNYGHDKVESVSALGETALLFLLSGVVIWEAIKRLVENEAHVVVASVWAFGVIIVSMLVDYFRARALTRTAKKTQSQALEADALHFSSDLWSSFAVLIGLVGVHFGFVWADSASAILVAVLVCSAGWRLGRRTINTLTDVAPEGAAEKFSAIAAKVPGVVAIEQVRARAVGDKTFIDLVVALSNETVLDRVMVIARNRALAVHHVTVHEIRGRLAVSLDLEVDGKLTLRAAHDLADGLESAIAGELGLDVEVETHIEPLEPQAASGRDAPPERVKAVEMALAELAPEIRTIRDVHDVRVRETAEGEIVNFHCRVDPDLSVQTVHEKVDALERALRARSPSIKRVIGHAEPTG
jgi:cation diffusion facilitator family transporter